VSDFLWTAGLVRESLGAVQGRAVQRNGAWLATVNPAKSGNSGEARPVRQSGAKPDKRD
jgi:hypothetical protein